MVCRSPCVTGKGTKSVRAMSILWRIILALLVHILCIILEIRGIGGNAYRRRAFHLMRKASPRDHAPSPACEQNFEHFAFTVTNRSLCKDPTHEMCVVIFRSFPICVLGETVC